MYKKIFLNQIHPTQKNHFILCKLRLSKMTSSFSTKLGNFLYKICFPLYKVTYASFKNKQDTFEIELLKKHIRPDNTVLDIGANIGFYATILSDLVGDKGSIHCYYRT